MADKISFSTQISGRVRLATESDVPHLHKLMYQMANYHNYTKVFNATEASISANLFKSNNPCPPFYSVTTFILEVSPKVFPQKTTNNSMFDPIMRTINLDLPIFDSEFELFRTYNDNNVSSVISQVKSGEDGAYADLSLFCEGRETVSDRLSTEELLRTNNNNISGVISQVGSAENDAYAALSLSCEGRETVSNGPSAEELSRTNNNNMSCLISQVKSAENGAYATLPLSCERRKTVSNISSAEELFRTNNNNNNISNVISQVGSAENGAYAAFPLSCEGRESTVSNRPWAEELLKTNNNNNNNISSVISQVESEENSEYTTLPLPCEDRKTVSDRLSTTEDNNVIVAGYVLFYPSYSGYFDKPGFFIENMYVRECYRKCGFGKMLFSAVASQAVKMGFTKVDWLTVGWNHNAIDFYLGMGAYVMQDVKRFRLSGEGLHAFAKNDQGDDKS